jgi:hypothetical protein
MKTITELTREAGGFEPTPAFLERLIELVRADERERLYGKDIDTLLFEEHRLGFEKGSRSEREVCAKLCDEARAARLAEQIRARGETK